MLRRLRLFDAVERLRLKVLAAADHQLAGIIRRIRRDRVAGYCAVNDLVNREKLAEADNLFMSEIEAGNEKAACIYAYQLYRDNKKEEACQIMASCPDDKDNLKKACRM